MHHARVLRNKLVKEYAAFTFKPKQHYLYNMNDMNFCPLATSPPTILFIPYWTDFAYRLSHYCEAREVSPGSVSIYYLTKYCLSIAETATLGLLPQCFSASPLADAVDHCKDDRSSMIVDCLLCGSCFPLDSWSRIRVLPPSGHLERVMTSLEV